MSDRDIIEGFLRNDIPSHRIVSDWVYCGIRSNAHKPSLSVDDVACDSIAKILVNLREGRFRSDSSLKTYVQRIARYTLIDALRSGRFTRTDNNDAVSSVRDPSDPLSVLEAAEERDRFHRVLSALDGPSRDLLTMIFHEELPYKVISKRLGISEGAVKTRVLRCKERAARVANDLG